MFIDIDEFLYLDKVSLHELLDMQEPDTGALFVFWKTYNANGHKNYSPEPVQERFTRECEGELYGKSFVRSSHAWFMIIGRPELHKGRIVNTEGRMLLKSDIPVAVYQHAYIKHYFTKSY